MTERGEVIWAPDPFAAGDSNPRPWLLISTDRLPYANEESIGVALTTQSHHPGSFDVTSSAWNSGEPSTPSYVLPWTIATLKDDLHVVGKQGTVTEAFVERVAETTGSYLDRSTADSQDQ
ncbi:hypothetical protein GCM10028857_01020 [Salinarchaeum chitinilyticum]